MTTAQIDLDKGGIDVLRAIIKLPREPAWATPAVLTQLIREEAAIRDDLVAYGYAYGALDLDGLMEHFADDVVLVNPSGTYRGSAIVRRNYEWLFKDWPSARHHWGEVAVRFVAPDEAYRSSIIWESHPKQMWMGISTDIHHLKKLGGRWKIIKRCIVMDGGFKLFPEDEEDDSGRRDLLAEADKAKR